VATNETSDINTALRKADPLVRAFVRSLKKENVRLQKVLAALAAKLVSAENRIAALKKTGADPLDLLTPEQTRAQIAQAQDEVGVIQGLEKQLAEQLAELEKRLKE
jgi:predicted  nucleic acid-binding Zn-ribbon protein